MSSDPEDPTYCGYTEYRKGRQYEELPATGDNATGIEADLWDALSDVEDPEMPISVVDLGLIYGIFLDPADRTDKRDAVVEMTLTYSGCPARDMLVRDVEDAVESVDGIADCRVRLVWSPEWSVEMVTESGREALREFGLSI